MSDRIRLSAQVSPESGGQRLDQVAAQLFPDYSRSRLQGWIKDGSLLVDGEVKRTRDIVLGGERLELDAEREIQGEWQAEAAANERIDLVVSTRGAHALLSEAGRK